MPTPVSIWIDFQSRLNGIRDALNGMRRLQNEANSFGASLRAGFGIDFAARLTQGLETAGRAMTGFVTEGVKFNARLQDATVGLAGVFRTFDKTGQFKTFQEAMTAAQDALVVLQDAAKNSPASFDSLVSGFQSTAGAAGSAGLSIKQHIDLVVRMSQALSGLGLQSDQLAQEMRAIFSGEIDANTQSAQMLVITREMVAHARETGTLYDLLKGKVAAFGEATVAAGGNVNQIMTNLQDSLQIMQAQLSQDLFAVINEGALLLKQTVESPAFREGLEPLMRSLTHVAQGMLENARIATEWGGVVVTASRTVGAAFDVVRLGVRNLAEIFVGAVNVMQEAWGLLGEVIATALQAPMKTAQGVVAKGIQSMLNTISLIPGMEDVGKGGSFVAGAIADDGFQGAGYNSSAITQRLEMLKAQLTTTSQAIGENTAAANASIASLFEGITETGAAANAELDGASERLDKLQSGPVGGGPAAASDIGSGGGGGRRGGAASAGIPTAQLTSPAEPLQTGMQQMQEQTQQIASIFTGPIQGAVQGIVGSIQQLIQGTTTWGEVLMQVGSQALNAIVSGIVNMATEWVTSRLMMVATGTATNAQMLASETATATATAAAWTPAAMLKSIVTFGAAALVGAAMMAGVMAMTGGFNEGGLIPGAPSARDNRLAAVATGEYVARAAAVQYYGPGVFEALNRMQIPREAIGGMSVPNPRARARWGYASGGLVGPSASMGGGGTAGGAQDMRVSIAQVKDRNEMRRFLESSDGQRLVVDANRKNQGLM